MKKILIKLLIGAILGVILCLALHTRVGIQPEFTPEEIASMVPNQTAGVITPSKFGLPVSAPVTQPDFVFYAYYGIFDNILADENIKNKISSKIDTSNNENKSLNINITNGALTVHFDDKNNAKAFDLRTGDEFTLRDIFADNVDAEAELNRYLSFYLLNTENPYIAQFKGISMSTPFYFNTNSLTLCFDGKTPPFGNTTLSIPLKKFGNYGDVIAVFNRFPPLDSALSSGLGKYSDSLQAKWEPSKYLKQVSPAGVTSYMQIPASYETSAIETVFIDYIAKFNDDVKKIPPGNNIDIYCLYERYGDMYVITYSNSDSYEVKTRNVKTGKEVKIADIFKENVDWRPIIRSAINNRQNQQISDAEFETIITDSSIGLNSSFIDIHPKGTYSSTSFSLQFGYNVDINDIKLR
ncbi:MAG: hypothetical protein LBL34_03785 [Clostridiales bacterium]|jgi:hypothetical protein|nr:hypothetical protein [Clostridiales bacterium]